MPQKTPSTTPSVTSSNAPASHSANKLDPIAVLREELAAAAICHGVERVEDLTEALISRVVQRLGGVQVYVPGARTMARERVTRVIRERFDGRNLRALAGEFGISLRHARRIVSGTF